MGQDAAFRRFAFRVLRFGVSAFLRSSVLRFGVSAFRRFAVSVSGLGVHFNCVSAFRLRSAFQ
eukprot:15275058-Alexandrium_andersonii.AAC.1